jgi:uncharacterized coiled-coil DUF342 family protein
MTTVLKEPKQVAVKKKVDQYGPRIADLSEQLAYLLGVVQEHAEVIKELRTKVDQVRGRMGL